MPTDHTSRHAADPAAGATRRRRAWTPDQIRQLGMTTDLATAADIIGISRTLAYELARSGQFPVRRLRLGRRVVIPTADLLTYLTREGPPASDAD